MTGIEGNKDIASEIEALLTQSKELSFKKDKTSLEPAKRALLLSQSASLKNFEARSYIAIAQSYCDAFFEYKTAVEYCLKALNAIGHEPEGDIHIRAYTVKGLALHYSGDLERSHASYVKAITISERKGTKTNEEKDALGNLYYNMSVLFRTKEFIDIRKGYLERAQQLYNETGNRLGLSRSYNAYSSFFAYNDQPEVAIEYQQKALAISRDLNDNHGIAVYLNNIGSMYVDMGDFSKAKEYLYESLQMKKSSDNQYSLAVSYMHIGQACKHEHNYTEAVDNFLMAQKIFEQLDSRIYLHEIFEHLADSYAALKEFEKAYYARLKYQQLKEEIYNFDKRAAITDAKTKHELEKKEREADLLRQKNAEIQEYMQKLEVSNSELQQFAHVASHDLKEPLRMISSYLALLNKRGKEKLDEEELQFISYAIDGAKRMDALIADLLALSKLNHNLNYERIDLNSVLSDVLKNLGGMFTEKRVMIEADLMPEITADRTQMIQLFQNLVSNGIKYNTSDIAEVIIKYSNHDGQHHFSFTDNGIGIPDEYREKIFVIFQRLHSRDEYSGTGIGLAICKKVVEQLRGKIWVEHNPAGGSIFNLSIPV